MEKNHCSWRQIIEPGTEVTSGSETISNKTKKQDKSPHQD